MTSAFDLRFELGHITRDDDTDWEEIEPLHIELWEQIAFALSSRSYKHETCEADVRVNWAPLCRRLRSLHNLRKQAYQGNPATFDWSPFWKPLTLTCHVTLSNATELSDYEWYPLFFAELYAYDVFLQANLALPGACNFLNLSIRAPRAREAVQPRLAGFPYDFALTESRRGRFPSIAALPLERVTQWHSKLALDTRQTAETPVEKAVFSLLHLSRTDEYTEAVIWVFYALEALVETRVGESISTLVRRLSLLLALTDPDTRLLNKRLRELYNFRSSIVHGGYKVTHPIRQEVVDKKIQAQTGHAIDLYQFGFTILLAAIQALVSKGWTSISFGETMIGNEAP